MQTSTDTTTADMQSESTILAADDLLAALTAGEFDASVAAEAAKLKAALAAFLRACGETV